MAERSNASDSKSDYAATCTGVRIPLLPFLCEYQS